MSRISQVPVFARASMLALLAFLLASCGGGGGGGTTGTNTVVRFAVDWGARSRALEGPGSAQSLRLTILGAGVPSGNFVYTGNRDANAAAHTQNFVTPGQAVSGSRTVQVSFFSEANGAGSVVGTASATMNLQTNGNLVGTITTTGTIATVTVTPGQTVLVGDPPADLLFTARNSANQIVAVAPGAAVWAVVTGPDKIEFDQGRARGLAAGTPTVTAAVDGHVSPATTVTVTAAPTVQVTVSPPSVTLDRNQTQQFTAVVTGTGNTAVTWSVQGGAGNGTINGSGLYTAPNVGGMFTVVATSVAEPTAFGTASVTVSSIPSNKIFYALGSAVDPTEYRMMNSDGTGDALVATYTLNFEAIAPNPTTPQYAFAYSTDPLAADPVWRLYKNTTIALAGATQLSATNFRFFGTIRFTPDGTQLVFTGSIAEGEFGVYRINSNGTGQVRLGDGEEADISPDGTKIVYTKFDGTSGAGEIWTMNLDGTGQTRLTNNAFEDWFPQWSKDGAKISFSTDRTGQFDIHTMSANGSGVARVTSSLNEDEFGSSFSPDGNQLAVTAFGLDTGLYRINANGTGSTPLLLATNIFSGVFWSPGTTRPGAIGPWYGGNPRHRRERR